MNTSPEFAIRTQNLSRKFNGTFAVQGVSFDIPRGKIFGFIGPSGCGKTTTVRLLMGIYRPTSGQMLVLGQQPHHFSQPMRARIGYMPQLFVLYQDLSIRENLNFTASLYGVGLRRAKRRSLLCLR